ncbi:synaptic vesicle glycoprotein 2B isoform X1 [Neodiprion pinetum]|uniref:synaptic vesicle glycoprotein 2B isoform X1 n=1 Tax=Neodiprion pinetum TaxID=441929 RepID=UPI001EDF1F78|nr:synaptic vesicle glycoprotein 2B-like isoform X1 [Neodiprion pinetum]XP_046480592.1 synaptic vesicle glycoprotein 2B-like isoform X1 [Neodiprion pinetum]XP_046480593.1 synaptic vesicle glycoprotein 2B-like isoform X1 [Neodiprion pinetum]
MPSSEEESLLWLAGSGGSTGSVVGSVQGSVGSVGSAPSAHHHPATGGHRSVTIRAGLLYTEEMSSQGPGSAAVAAAAGVTPASADPAEHDLIDSTADATLLAQFHEDAIKQAGVGSFQALVALCAGLSLAADTVEFFVVPYILPSAEVELCIEDNEKGWLGNITLVGLALGGLCWGGLGDRLGRRRALLSAMAVHALFSGVATFMPTYGTFMTARFCSAIGVGGALPLSFAYLAECCPRSSRGCWTGALVGAGALGGVYAALLAWAVVPTTGEMVVLENKEHFSAWHRFLLLCCLPALSATIGLVFLPESPRYLVEAGRDVEAMMVYQRIYKKNSARKGGTGAQYQLSELELPSKRPRGLAPSSPATHASVLADILYSIEMFWNSFLQLFSPPHLRITIVLLIIWVAAAFGLYGLMAWCPEYLKLLRATEYEAQTIHYADKTHNGRVFNGSLENLQYKNSKFINCKFTKMIFSHVDFDNCTFQNVEFSSIKSSKTHFTDSTIVDSKFVDTDLSAQVFIRCKLENNTELSLSGPCPSLDLDYNIYIEEALHGHLVAQLAFVPAAALAGFALTVVQRPKMIGISLFLSSMAALSLMLVGTNSLAILGFEGGFIVVFAVAWTSLTMATVESFPTHLRCTGFGFMTAGIRLSGLIGTATYQTLIGAPLIAPALLTATALFIGSIATFKLPQTHTVFL